MISVEIKDRTPNEIIDIVRELRTQGLVQGKDFDFAYHASRWDTFGHEPPTRRFTVFTFYDEKLATWFILKWA